MCTGMPGRARRAAHALFVVSRVWATICGSSAMRSKDECLRCSNRKDRAREQSSALGFQMTPPQGGIKEYRWACAICLRQCHEGTFLVCTFARKSADSPQLERDHGRTMEQ